jgi:hypothetical protein
MGANQLMPARMAFFGQDNAVARALCESAILGVPWHGGCSFWAEGIRNRTRVMKGEWLWLGVLAENTHPSGYQPIWPLFHCGCSGDLVIQVFFGAHHVARLVSGKGRTLSNRVLVWSAARFVLD